MRNTIAMILLAAAFALLVPGLILPMIQFNGYLDKTEIASLGKDLMADNSQINSSTAKMVSGFIENLNLSGTVDVYDKSRSILGTVRDLFRTGDYPVGFLILLFSVIVPVIKASMLVVVLAIKREGAQRRMLRWSSAISKWSMADVFVVAVFVAYLAAKATQNTRDYLFLDARFEIGFYCFAGYCLLSLGSAQLITLGKGKAAP
jgi:hypothetical protein